MSHDQPLAGLRFLMFVGDEYEDLEVWYPKLRLTEAGAHVTMAGLKADTLYKGKHGYPCRSEAAIEMMESSDFHGVILPGGVMPDKLRREQKVKDLIREFAEADKLVAAICHGGWMAISARVYQGVKVTGSLGIKDDLENAGAIWKDAPVIVDRNFVSSRKPDDLPHFCQAIIEVMSGVAAAN